MPPINPEDAAYLLQKHVLRDMDNLNVMQRSLDLMVRDAQQGTPLNQVYSEVQGGKLGESMVWTRQYIQGMQAYLARAQAAIAEGGTTALDFLRSARGQTAAIGEQAMAYVESHPAESATLAGATGQAGIQLAGQGAGGTAAAGTAAEGSTVAAGAAAEGSTVAAGAAGAAAEGSTVAAGAAAEGSTIAAGVAAEGSTIAAGVAAEGSTIAAGVVAETTLAAGTVAETAVVATTAVAATEVGAGATLAAGAAGGSWLGPVGIAVGLTIAAAVLTVTYVATHKDSPKTTPVVASARSSSSTDTDSSSTDTDSSSSSSSSKSSSTDTDSSSSDTDSSTSQSSSSGSVLGIAGRYVLTEDKSRFSPGSSDSFDPLGCAGRRVPDVIDVSLPRPGFITLRFAGEPGGSPFDHDGTIDSNNGFVVDYPDASGTEIQGRFENFGSEIDLLDGEYFTGDCTFYFTGKRQ